MARTPVKLKEPYKPTDTIIHVGRLPRDFMGVMLGELIENGREKRTEEVSALCFVLSSDGKIAGGIFKF